MYSIVDWYLGDAEKDVVVWGICNNHPNMPSCTLIHTSAVANVIKEDDAFIFVTRSGSEYRALFADMDDKKLEDNKMICKRLDISVKELEKCIEEREKAEKDENLSDKFYLRRILGPMDIYIELNANNPIKAYAMYEEGDIHKVKCDIEMGMFEDSAVITDGSRIDFRYTKKGFADIDPYSWSDDVHQIKFYNKGAKAFFRSKFGDVTLPTDELIIIDISDYKDFLDSGEGTSVLMSDPVAEEQASEEAKGSGDGEKKDAE